MPRRHPAALDRCRALIQRGAGVVLVLGLALVVFTTQLVLQMHATKHELLPGVHQVCEQCVTAEHSAPPPAVEAVLAAATHAVAPDLFDARAPLARTPSIERARGPPATDRDA